MLIPRGWPAGARPGLSQLSGATLAAKYGKVKQLRRGGKRLSTHDIQRADYVEMRVYSFAA
jgi:hypothetical protein